VEQRLSFCVLGAGAWGTSFAVHLVRLGHRVVLSPRREEHARALRDERVNTDYLPGITLPEALIIESDLSKALSLVDLILFACPSQALRDTARSLKRVQQELGLPPLWAISLAKGLEAGSHQRPSQILTQELPGWLIGSLTGPTNAGEVARGLPAAMLLASEAPTPALQAVQTALSGPSLRVYTSDDLPGAEFGGCLKNIYAIAAGCSDGLKLGDNAKAALLTRALTEMLRVGTSLGARLETFYGLSGFGDLVATCHGAWSRNREFGQKLGEGQSIGSLTAGRRTVVEGYRTTASFHELCLERGIEAPILTEVHRICHEAKPPREALSSLMTRELKKE